MILIVYGSRTWRDWRTVYDVIELCRPRLVVHGGHWQGADQFAYDYCDRNGVLQIEVEAPWENKELGKDAGPFRNGIVLLTAFLMGDWYAEPVIACGFRKDGKSDGTDDMHHKCELAKVQQKISANVCGNEDAWTELLASGEFEALLERHRVEGFAPAR